MLIRLLKIKRKEVHPIISDSPLKLNEKKYCMYEKYYTYILST